MAKKRQRYAENKQAERLRVKTWKANNPAKVTAIRAAMKDSRRIATPAWLSKTQRDEIYKTYIDAKRISALTGVAFEVDHIVPIRGRRVCGLHVPWNLRVIQADQNREKANRLIQELGVANV